MEDDIDISTKLGTLVLICKERFDLNLNQGYLLANSLKLVFNIILEIYSNELQNENKNQPFVFDKIHVYYCPSCVGGVEISLESIFTSLEISSKTDNLVKLVLCFASNLRKNICVNLDCDHKSHILIKFSNKIVKLFKDDNNSFDKRINDFGEFGRPKIRPGAVPIKDYEKVLSELILSTETRGLPGAWYTKKEWILRNKPESIFQDYVYGFLNGYFTDGEIHEQVHLAGGFLDFALEGVSLSNEAVLIEIKWTGKSISRSKSIKEISYTYFSTNEILGGIDQLKIYQNGYTIQRKKNGIPILLVFDAEEKQKALEEIGNLNNNIEIKWVRLSATSPSRR